MTFYQSVRLEAGHALALFAYNNPKQQAAILETGIVPVQAFETFLGSGDETERAKAAFQVRNQCLLLSYTGLLLCFTIILYLLFL